MDKLPCEVCGNEYDKAFKVVLDEATHVFDSFECAISALAPVCGACENRIIGHGVEVDDHMYCCAHCAKNAGKTGVKDRVDTARKSA